MPASSEVRRTRTDHLEIAYEQSGPDDGPAVILLHGFPDDPRCWDGVVPGLVEFGVSRPDTVAARLRRNPVPRPGNAAFRPAGGARG